MMERKLLPVTYYNGKHMLRLHTHAHTLSFAIVIICTLR